MATTQTNQLAGEFDVYLSYEDGDRQWVGNLKRELEDRGKRAYMPGATVDVPADAVAAIEKSRCLVLVKSQIGLTDGQFSECREFMRIRAPQASILVLLKEGGTRPNHIGFDQCLECADANMTVVASRVLQHLESLHEMPAPASPVGGAAIAAAATVNEASYQGPGGAA